MIFWPREYAPAWSAVCRSPSKTAAIYIINHFCDGFCFLQTSACSGGYSVRIASCPCSALGILTPEEKTYPPCFVASLASPGHLSFTHPDLTSPLVYLSLFHHEMSTFKPERSHSRLYPG